MKNSVWFASVLISISMFAGQELVERSSRGAMETPIAGKVRGSDRLEIALLRIQLIEMNSRRVLAETLLNIDGSFQLPASSTGFFEVRVIGPAGETRHLQEVNNGASSYLDIQLPQRRLSSGEATISALRLQQKPSKKTRRALGEAAKAIQQGNRLVAIEHLSGAVVNDPECFDILSNLGALYLQERQPAQALPYLEQARKIDPTDGPNNVNLSAYYANMDDFNKAEEYALAALRANPNSARGHYMLAYAMVKQGKDVDSAKAHLKQIQNEFAPARKLLLSLTPQQ